MTARALPFLLAAIPLVALAATPLAGAAGEGGELEAAAPVTLEGRADTWLPGGTTGFLGSGATELLHVALRATQADLVLREEHPCGDATIPLPGAPPCPPGGYLEEDKSARLRDVTITVEKATSAYKLLATTDRAHLDGDAATEAGRILVTTATTTTLAAAEEDLHITGADEGWVGSSSQPPFEPVYDAPALSSRLDSNGAVLRVAGGFETFLQGVQVRVVGIDEDGNAFDETFDTRLPDEEDEAYAMLLVETQGGDLVATSSAPLVGFAPADERPITDVHTRASFQDATGTVALGGDERSFADEPASFEGPLSLRLVAVDEGAPARLTYALTPGLALADGTDDARDEPVDPVLLAAAGAAGAGGAGALLALAYVWPRLKHALTLALLPMYTRIERDAVLEHGKRDELYELIRQTPGIHAHEIGEKTHIGWGTTVYHLKLLENHGLIVSKRTGRYKRFFVNTGEYTKKKDVYGALRNDTAKSVAQYIVDHPGTTQKEMCAALGIQPSLASWHVEKLESVELVKRVKDGRMVRYFAGHAWADLNVRVHPLGGGDAPAET